MNIASYLARYLLALIFAVEVAYKFMDWPGWEAQFASMLPIALPFGIIPIAAILLAALEVIVLLLLLSGREKFITGILAALLLLSILVAQQAINIGYGLYADPLAATRGILQDQHLWMMLAAGFVVAEGWGSIKQRFKK